MVASMGKHISSTTAIDKFRALLSNCRWGRSVGLERVAISKTLYFIFVGCFAVWVGLWGYGFPAEVARALPWPVPPLHSRFIGAMYLSGTILMFGTIFVAGRRNVRIALWMAAIWTGMLMLVSLLHLAEFDFAKPQVWFWFAAYAVYPVVGAWLARQPATHNSTPSALPGWARTYFLVQGTIAAALALLLFFLPANMVALWPWAIPPLLAQIYAGPFLSYAVGSFLLTRGWGDDETMPLLAMLAFAVLVLLASIIHRGVFGAIGPAALLWFGGFAAATIVLAYLSARSRMARP